jgi:3-deoxy-D-manno-octulosonic-acid transferase
MLANVCYCVALLLLWPIILYRMVRHGRYRRGIGQKLWGLSKADAQAIRDNRDCIWIHAVSVGEVNLLPRIVRQLQQSRPQHAIAISTSTDTGYDLAVKHFGTGRVIFCPLDFSWAVKRTLRNLQPLELILVELELWPNLIRIAHRQRCDVLVINARLSKRSAARYQKFAALTRPTFARLDWVGCQDQACQQRFAACGTSRSSLHVTGSLKFDDAPSSRETVDVESRAQWAGIDPWHRVWVFGSTQRGEETMALAIYHKLRTAHPELRLILVPRHRERFDEVADSISRVGLRVHRRSQDKSLDDDRWQGGAVILIDTIGELRHWWGVAQIATVGGSFGSRGGQNMLEPAGYGCAVSFGPNTRNFDEIANRLIAARGAVRVADQLELERFVGRCLIDIPAADSLGRSAREVVRRHRGATQRTVEALCSRERPQRRAA